MALSSQSVGANSPTTIAQGGGLVAVNADGSVSITPASGKHTRVTSGRLGLGVAPAYLLDVLGDGSTWAAHISNAGNAVSIEQPTDLGSTIADCINVTHRSTGDGLFFLHYGGVPSGFGGATGGKASLNVLIPQYIDFQAASNGRTQGTGTANTKTGQIGLYVEVQPTAGNAAAISIASWSNGSAIYVNNQPSAGGYTLGNGNAMQIDSGGSGHPLFVGAAGSGNIQFELTGTGGVLINDNASSISGDLFAVVARSASTIGFGMRVTADTGDRIQMRPDSVRFGTGTGTIDCNLFRSGTKAMKFGDSSGGNSRLEVPGGVATLAKAGTISDSDFPSTPINGTLAVDTTNNVLYVRVGVNTYKTVALS